MGYSKISQNGSRVETSRVFILTLKNTMKKRPKPKKLLENFRGRSDDIQCNIAQQCNIAMFILILSASQNW